MSVITVANKKDRKLEDIDLVEVDMELDRREALNSETNTDLTLGSDTVLSQGPREIRNTAKRNLQDKTDLLRARWSAPKHEDIREMLKKFETENRDGKEVQDEVLEWLRTRSIKMIVEEAWDKVSDLETNIENLNLPVDNDQSEVLQEFVGLLVEIARVWHMDVDNEEVKEDDKED